MYWISGASKGYDDVNSRAESRAFGIHGFRFRAII